MILPDMALDDTRQRAETLRERIEALEVKHLGLAVGRVTASFGVACFPEHGRELEAVVRAADTALFRAKNEGRNRVAVSGPFTATGTS